MGAWRRSAVCAVALSTALAHATASYSAEDARGFLTDYCAGCHRGEQAAARFRTASLGSLASFREQPETWAKVAMRVAHHEMPPVGSPSPPLDDRLEFTEWVRSTWRSQACAASLEQPPAMVRRLNREEYSATLRDLLDLQIDTSAMLPVDGPGGEGFDNAAETLFLSPLLAEKYLETAKFVLDAASKEFKARHKLFVARPGHGVTEREAARAILAEFLPRAFRRPVDAAAVEAYLQMFRKAKRRGRDFESAVFFAVRSALVSPAFLFHVDPSEGGPAVRQYALASKLSYFLWGTMPDELLFDIAAAGKMDDPAVLRRLVPRMLRDDRALEFATRFVGQWLRTRELEGPRGPDAELFPEYAANAELQGDILLQPIFFFREIVRENRSLLNLLDSDGTVLTRQLIEHLELPLKKKQDGNNPNWMDLPEGSGRGGLLGMPAVLALASHPHRTSPVLRGVWILDSILGTPPPPPPPDVPELDEPEPGEPPRSVRAALDRHRQQPGCASCHARIDPLGYALENYDVLGKWRSEDGGVPIDASGALPDGTRFDGPAALKEILLDRREAFLRNLTRRMLGYALGRGLTIADACAVEAIRANVVQADHAAWELIRQVVQSRPFLAPSQPAGASGTGESP